MKKLCEEKCKNNRPKSQLEGDSGRQKNIAGSLNIHNLPGQTKKTTHPPPQIGFLFL